MSATAVVASVESDFDDETLGPPEVNGVPVDPCFGRCLTYPANFTDYPAISVPVGLAEEGRSVVIRLIVPRFKDTTVLAPATAVERGSLGVDTSLRLRSCEHGRHSGACNGATSQLCHCHTGSAPLNREFSKERQKVAIAGGARGCGARVAGKARTAIAWLDPDLEPATWRSFRLRS